ncbi:hypothetical protein K239x_13660 [Planctomycetes bacterium K23_9]|uniref:Uncharacterized protein n=1 Tax=Stieleria marina TaxID=1930275 RepID=A0A517NQM8_9BACT|nr:hypothetical protein K239x_13660 [Planctomycetes bacterium K23_9]
MRSGAGKDDIQDDRTSDSSAVVGERELGTKK